MRLWFSTYRGHAVVHNEKPRWDGCGRYYGWTTHDELTVLQPFRERFEVMCGINWPSDRFECFEVTHGIPGYVTLRPTEVQLAEEREHCESMCQIQPGPDGEERGMTDDEIKEYDRKHEEARR